MGSMRDKLLTFKMCSSRTCQTCPKANKLQINNDSDNTKFCKVFNCIYKIKCNECNMSYIGQTSNPLHMRVNLHRSNINKYKINKNTNFEFMHFKKHNFNNITIHILDIIKCTSERLYYENLYIHHHKTVFPYGLNQLFNNNQVPPINQWFIKQPNITIYNYLHHSNTQVLNLESKRSKRGKKVMHRKSPNNILDYKHKLHVLLQEFNNSFNFSNLKNWIFSLKKKYIIQVYNFIKENQTDNIHFNYLVLDLLITRANFLNINCNKPKDFVSKYCVINFCNPVLNYVSFQKIFNYLNDFFPLQNINIKNAYKYPLPVGRKIFNYNHIAKNFDKYIDNSFCICSNYTEFIDQHHGHVVTGNLNIVNNECLKNIMKFGCKFKLPSKLSFRRIIASISSDLDIFIYKTALQFSYPVEGFNMWKNKVLEMCGKNIFINFKYSKTNYKDLNTAIKQLQDKFVITYIDKAANNYAIMCKSFYSNYIFKLLENNTIFKPIKDKSNTIIKKVNAFYKLLKLKIKNINFPYVIIVPKFHKTPIAFRSITCGTNIYSSSANKLLLKYLTQMYEILTVNKLSILNNSYSLITSINNQHQFNHINTFDFKDLFNNIDIEDLNIVILKLFDLANSIKTLNINLSHFKSLLKFVTYNCYLFQNRIFYIQTKGVPQGSASSSILANLYLFYYEKNYNKNNDYMLFRYIDDVIIFSKNNIDIPSFYPINLELIKSSNNTKNVNYLDLNIIIQENGKITTDIYDKRNEYNFEIAKCQYFNSCLHKKVFKNIIINQLIRINRICSKDNINKQVTVFKQYLQSHNYPTRLIDSIINRFQFYYC